MFGLPIKVKLLKKINNLIIFLGDLNKSLKNEPETRYQIMFSSEHNYKTLQNNVPFYDKIEPEEVKTFR